MKYYLSEEQSDIINSLINKEKTSENKTYVPVDRFYPIAAAIAEVISINTIEEDEDLFKIVWDKLGEIVFYKIKCKWHKPDPDLANKRRRQFNDFLDTIKDPADPLHSGNYINSKLEQFNKIEKGYIANDEIEQGRDQLIDIIKDRSVFNFNVELFRSKIHVLEKDLPRGTPNPIEFVKAAEDLLPNLMRTTLGTSLTCLRRFVENIRYNMDKEFPDHKTAATQQPQCLRLFSEIGGTGKGEFIRRLEDYIKSYDLPVAHYEHDLKWMSPHLPRSIIGINSEAMVIPVRVNGYHINRTRKNLLIDDDYVMVEQKGIQPVSIKSRTTLVEGSNFRTVDLNGRREESIVEFNEFPLVNIINSLSKQEQDFLHLDWTDKQWNDAFDRLFMNCPYGMDFTQFDQDRNNTYSLDDLIHKAREILSPLSKVKNELFNNRMKAADENNKEHPNEKKEMPDVDDEHFYGLVTIRQFCNFVRDNADNSWDNSKFTAFYRNTQKEFIKLQQAKRIKGYGTAARLEYKKLYIEDLAKLDANEDSQGFELDYEETLFASHQRYEDIITELKQAAQKLPIRKTKPPQELPIRKTKPQPAD